MIIINATNIGKDLTGIGRYSLSISLCFLEYWDYPFQIIINRSALVHFKKAKNRDKIKVISGALSPDLGFRGHAARLLWSNRFSLLNQNNLIFATSPLEGSLFHKKQIITVHDIIPLVAYNNFKKQYYYFKYILPFILKNAVKILTVSENSKSLIIDYYKISEEKIVVINNGVSKSFFSQEANFTKQNYILYIGRLTKSKNIKGIINAFHLLINKYKIDLRLKLSGKYEMLDFKINNATKKKIDFVGSVPEKELINLYRNASLFIFPSFHEGFGLPPLEAMASGCPVVISNEGSLLELCGDAAYPVDPYNVDSIANGIYKVLSDSILRQRLIQNGLERFKLFCWEDSAKKHIKVFNEVLNNT